MTVTVRIDADTQTGKKLISDLRQHPETVEFIEPENISEKIPEGYVSLKEGFDVVREHVKSVYTKPENKR